MTPTAYLGLGSNVGERGRHLRDALTLLGDGVTIQQISSVYESEPVGFKEQRSFWNLVVCVTTSLTPGQLLARVLDIEQRLGRERSFRNAPRTIDIDILVYDDVVLSGPGLELPHPRMHERAFVLMPLSELAPGLRDPRSGTRYRDLLESGKFEAVQRIGELADLEKEAGKE